MVNDSAILNSFLMKVVVCIGIIQAITLVGEDPRLDVRYSHNDCTARCSSVLSFVAL